MPALAYEFASLLLTLAACSALVFAVLHVATFGRSPPVPPLPPPPPPVAAEQREEGGRRQHAVVVLILAHDGVAQVSAWESWLAAAAAQGLPLRVAVHCPLERACPWARARRLDIPFGPSAWASVGIVRETLRAFGALLSQDAEPFLLLLASGACVPVTPPAAAFRLSYNSCFGAARPSRFYPGHFWADQWCILTREDCHYLVDRLHSGRLERFTMEYGFGVAPDMILFLTLLPTAERRGKLTYDENSNPEFMHKGFYATCLQYFLASDGSGHATSRFFFRSPVQWSSADAPIWMSNEQCPGTLNPGKPLPWSLRMTLLHLRLQSERAASGDFLFMRKVDRSVFLDPPLLRMLYCSASADEITSAFEAALATARQGDAMAGAMAFAKLEKARQVLRGNTYMPDTQWWGGFFLGTAPGRLLFCAQGMDLFVSIQFVYRFVLLLAAVLCCVALGMHSLTLKVGCAVAAVMLLAFWMFATVPAAPLLSPQISAKSASRSGGQPEPTCE